jgi:hypothetical protein
MKFSIRDLLLVTVIVALAFGLWVKRAEYLTLQEENARLSRRLEETERLMVTIVTEASRKQQGPVSEAVYGANSSALAPKLAKP